MKIVITGEPVPQARPRFTRKGIAYKSSKCREYQDRLAHYGKLYMLEHGLKPLDYALAVSVEVYVHVPKSWSKKKQTAALEGKLRPACKPDLDNYVKSLDGFNGVVWMDDALIVQLHAEKYYSGSPRMEVTIRPVF